MGNNSLFINHLELRNGKSLSKEKLITNGLYKVFGSNGIIGQTNESNIDADTIVIGRVGANCGSIQYSNTKSWSTDNTIIASVKPNNDPRFWYYLLSKMNLRDYAVGSAQPLLKQEIINSLEYVIPNYEIQRNIGYILNCLDQKIEFNNRINKNLESTAKAIYQEWFVNFNFSNEDGLPYKDNGGEFYETELGEIPVGWKIVEIGDLCNITIGGYWGEDKEFENSRPVICMRGTDLQNLKETGYSIDAPIRWVKESDLNKRIMDETDVLIGGSGLGPVGRSHCFVNEFKALYEYPIIYSNFCKRLKFNRKQLAIYVEHILEILHATNEINNYVNGTSVPNLDINGLLKHKIVLPNDDIILKFSKIKEKLSSKKFLGENKRLNDFKNLLLNKLMSGEIDTDELDINWDKLSETLKEIE